MSISSKVHDLGGLEIPYFYVTGSSSCSQEPAISTNPEPV